MARAFGINSSVALRHVATRSTSEDWEIERDRQKKRETEEESDREMDRDREIEGKGGRKRRSILGVRA